MSVGNGIGTWLGLGGGNEGGNCLEGVLKVLDTGNVYGR